MEGDPDRAGEVYLPVLRDDYPAAGAFPSDRACPGWGNFIGLVSDLRSRSAMRRLARHCRAHSDFPLEHTATFRFIPGVSLRDHRSFWAAGCRAVMVTDTAFYRYPYYHRVADTPDKLSYPALAQVTQELSRALAAFAEENGSNPA